MSSIGVIVSQDSAVYNRKWLKKFYKIFDDANRNGVQFNDMTRQSVFWQRAAAALLWAAGAFVFFRWLLAPLLPFLLALGLSVVTEPWVERVRKLLRVRRSFAAGVVTTAVLLVAGGGAGLGLMRLGTELREWTARLPEVMAGFPAVWNGFLDRLGSWYAASPSFVRRALDALAQALMDRGPSLAVDVGGWLMGTASGLLSALPDVGLFLVTTVLAAYFTSLSYPSILAFLKRQLPPAWQSKCRASAACFRSTVRKWLRAELTLIAATFGILLAGFVWMGLDYALLAAVFTAVVDALPVLGTGTVLLPWAAGCLLLGNTGRGIALAALYATALLTHTLLEPRLLAGQAEVPPVAALLAMYLGFYFLGVGGMVVFPIVMILVKQFHDAGIIAIWK